MTIFAAQAKALGDVVWAQTSAIGEPTEAIKVLRAK